MMRTAIALLNRDLTIALRIGGGGAVGLIFFLSIITLTPFAIGPDLNLLARIAPAIIWIAVLLATLLGLDRLFQADEDDGVLDVLQTSILPLELIVLIKCIAHWLTTALPLIIATPVFALMLGLGTGDIWVLSLSLLAGTPALTLIGAIGAALTVSVRRGGLLMAVLILPLTIPVLIFGVAAQDPNVPSMLPILVLVAFSLAAIALAPIAAAAALRHI